MKKYLVSIFTILFVIPAVAADNMVTISGKVFEKTVVDGKTEKKPVVGVTIVPENAEFTNIGENEKITALGTLTNVDGEFKITNFPANTNIKVSSMGYETQIVSPGENLEIVLETEELESVIVDACDKPNTKKYKVDKVSGKCFPTECVSDKYILTNSKEVPFSGYQICLDSSNEKCKNFCTDQKCETITIGDACEDPVGKKCTPDDPNYKNAIYELNDDKLVCKIQDCVKGFLPNDTKTACVKSEGECPKEKLSAIEHAVYGELRNGICYATKCTDGYDPNKEGKCVEISGDCTSMPQNATAAHRKWDFDSGKEVCIIDDCKENYRPSDDQLSCVSTLSSEDSKAKIAELQKNADEMKAKEQSTANSLLGAASIGAMGIGGMQTASALAEQNADEAAEQDMAAYLATFRCDYGQGMFIQGGESNITLPGANVLLPLYNEYTTLAADLKTRKEALGMTPGIESETILDAATSGLYDNAAIGKTDGAFTSLSSAMLYANSADAAEWEAQKSETASQLKTGATVAGVGALVGIAGNILINEVGDKPKENSAEIIAKYDAKRQTIRKELESVENQSMTDVTKNPPEAEEGKDPKNQEETKSSTSPTLPEIASNYNISSIDSNKISELTKGIETLPTANIVKKDPVITLYNESMFGSGKTEIESTTTLDAAIDKLKGQLKSENDFKIVLVAHTDADGIIQTSKLCKEKGICTNDKLSEARATAVKEYIKKKWPELSDASIITVPVGAQCAKKGADKTTKAKERRVAVYLLFGEETMDTSNVCSTTN